MVCIHHPISEIRGLWFTESVSWLGVRIRSFGANSYSGIFTCAPEGYVCMYAYVYKCTYIYIYIYN